MKINLLLKHCHSFVIRFSSIIPSLSLTYHLLSNNVSLPFILVDSFCINFKPLPGILWSGRAVKFIADFYCKRDFKPDKFVHAGFHPGLHAVLSKDFQFLVEGKAYRVLFDRNLEESNDL